jgi:hypothetical protein
MEVGGQMHMLLSMEVVMLLGQWVSDLLNIREKQENE